MLHWRASAILGLILTCEAVPLCALIHRAPDCMARRVAVRALGRAFGDRRHCERVHDTWTIGRHLRN